MTGQLLLVWCPECKTWKRLEEGRDGPMHPALVVERDGAAYWYRDHPEPCASCDANMSDPGK